MDGYRSGRTAAASLRQKPGRGDDRAKGINMLQCFMCGMNTFKIDANNPRSGCCSNCQKTYTLREPNRNEKRLAAVGEIILTHLSQWEKHPDAYGARFACMALRELMREITGDDGYFAKLEVAS
jgi:hypothetical protein